LFEMFTSVADKSRLTFPDFLRLYTTSVVSRTSEEMNRQIEI
jgi:hypothetical protein